MTGDNLDPDLLALEELSEEEDPIELTEFEQELEDVDETISDERLEEIIAFFQGGLSFKHWQALSKPAQRRYRRLHRGKGRRHGFIKGRPMSQAELNAYHKKKNKRRKAGKLARKKRRINQQNG